MPVGSNGHAPSYTQFLSISSAEVVLSDTRPIKLKIEGLRCINVFLDEFLYSILKAAHSLTTDKLRAGLLSVLPTPLGKEALLEAEVELRAYWDRTKPSKAGIAEDDAGSFNLQWAYELLRLKCEAYSTLNESDGEKSAETKLHERFAGTGQPPKPSLVAPAALYLTAILEAMCEHVLSNVGRVASRDSSRTYAGVQDVFVALCEDETVYNPFKSMDVYEQIEQLSQAPKPRRSFSRNDKSRPSTSHLEQSSGKESPNRLSSDMSHRSSVDRKKRGFSGRNSNSNESANGHRRAESLLSDEKFDVEEQASLQEFDDLMRSDSTMKVSLTPDRLKTMEVYKQEKVQRAGRPKPAPLHTGTSSELESSISSVPPRATRRPSVPNVAAIVEDEEEPATKPVPPRTRQASVASPPPKSLTSSANTRARSHSAAAPTVQPKSSQTSLPLSTPVNMMTTREFRGAPQGFDAPGFPQKTRKIQRARESLDLDEVMAGSDDEDLMDEPSILSPSKSFASNTSSATRVSNRTKELMDFLNDGPPSASGPGPNGYSNRPAAASNPASPPMSRAGRELMDFLNEGPPDFGPPPPSVMDNGSKSKGTGRLQRMISKLKLGEDRGRNVQQDDTFSRSTPPTPNPNYNRPPLSLKPSNGSLSTLGNRPVPPRYPVQPQMISPPSSPTRGTVDLPPSVTSPPPSVTIAPSVSSPASRPRQPSVGQSSINRKAVNWDQGTPVPLPTSAQPNSAIVADTVQPVSSRSRTTEREREREHIRSEHDLEDTKPLGPPKPASVTSAAIKEKSSTTKSLPATELKKSTARVSPIQTSQPDRKALAPTENTTPVGGGISAADAQEMKRMLQKATTSEECRLIMDIFLAKAGIPVERATESDAASYPSPSSSSEGAVGPSSSTAVAAPSASPATSAADNALEIALVELFLGGGDQLLGTHEVVAPRKKRYTAKKVKVDTQAAQANGNGNNVQSVQKPIAAAAAVNVQNGNGNGHGNGHSIISIPVSEEAALRA